MERVEEHGLPSPGRRDDEVAADASVSQSGAGLHFVVAVKVLQGALGHVDAPGSRRNGGEVKERN